MNEEKKLFTLIGEIEGLDEAAMKAAKDRQDYRGKASWKPGAFGGYFH